MSGSKVELEMSDILDGYIFNYRKEYEKHIRNALGIEEPEGVEIYNKSKLISDTEIRKIIELLHPVYQELDISITIHKSKGHTIRKGLNPFIDGGKRRGLTTAAKGNIAGIHREGVITLFPWAHQRVKNIKVAFKGFPGKKKEFLKLLIVADMLHEIRHAWQLQHKTKKYRALDSNYIQADGEGYHSQWLERDANAFSQRMMNNNKAKVSEILGISLEWDCIWGRFRATF